MLIFTYCYSINNRDSSKELFVNVWSNNELGKYAI